MLTGGHPALLFPGFYVWCYVFLPFTVQWPSSPHYRMLAGHIDVFYTFLEQWPSRPLCLVIVHLQSVSPGGGGYPSSFLDTSHMRGSPHLSNVRTKGVGGLCVASPPSSSFLLSVSLGGGDLPPHFSLLWWQWLVLIFLLHLFSLL